MKKEQLNELITALIGRDEIPLKLAYLESGAEKFKKVRGTRAYALVKSENELIKQHLSKKNIGANINIIDVGSGDGTKAIPFLKALVNIQKKLVYSPIDISKSMVDLASSNVKARVKNKIVINKKIIDFEKNDFMDLAELLRKYNPKNLVLFLGSTIGNVNSQRVLCNIRGSLHCEDSLIIGVQLFRKDKIPEMLSSYKNQSIYDLIFLPLKKIGVVKSDGHFDTTFNAHKKQIEIKFIFTKERVLNVSGRAVRIQNGRKILLTTSRKFVEKEIKALLDQADFRILEINMNDKKDYALIIAKPRHHSD